MFDSNFYLRLRSLLLIALALGVLLVLLPLNTALLWVLWALTLGAAYESGIVLRRFYSLFSGKQQLLAMTASVLQLAYYASYDHQLYAVLITAVALWYYHVPAPDGEKRLLAVFFIPALCAITWQCFAATFAQPKIFTSEMISPLSIAVMSDLSGYVMGKFFPSTRCDYAVSPKKTYEGFAAALLLPTLGYALLQQLPGQEFLMPYSSLQTLLISLAAIWGDLIFSLAKRLAHQKDYSTLIPGHGGVLDRIDSWVGALLMSFAL